MTHIPTEIRDSLKELMGTLEEKLSEASHRELGGFNTEDRKFAAETFDLLNELWKFMIEINNNLDDVECWVQSEVCNFESDAKAARDDISEMQQAVNAIADRTNYY
jgi:hypothetical protein